MQLRRPRPEEHDRIGAVTVAAYEPYLLGVEDYYRQQLLDVATRDREAEVWVAVDDDGTVVGFASVGPYRRDRDSGDTAIDDDGGSDRDIDGRVGEILAIYVDPARWGTGAGRALMDAVLSGLAGRGLTEIRLWVAEDNARARRFYERAALALDGQRSVLLHHRPGGGPPAEIALVRYTVHPGGRAGTGR